MERSYGGCGHGRLAGAGIITLGLVVASLVGPLASARAGGGVALLFSAPGRGSAEAERLKTVKYGGSAEMHRALPADDILALIERKGRAGEKIGAVEILGHGWTTGPYITADDAIPRDEDRLTVERLAAWKARLRAAGVDPATFFEPGATITIRACYVGTGALPEALLEILPADGKVESDADFYKNSAASAFIGGFWGRKRVTTRKSDVVYKKGDAGATDPFAGEKAKAARPEDFEGYWTGKATVLTVKPKADASSELEEGKTFQTIKYGSFIIRKEDGKDGPLLELEFMGNLLVGRVVGAEAIFEPVPGKGGNMKGAKLKADGKKLTGTVHAANAKIDLTRELDLKKSD